MSTSTLGEPESTRPGLRSTSPKVGFARLVPGDPLRGTPYHVGPRLSSGGMGELFLAHHERLGRTAVVKALQPRHRHRPDFAERLRDEARILASLGAPATPVVFDLGELADGRPFFVMERLEGCDLRAELDRIGIFSVPSAVRLGLKMLSALERVHESGIVHRDIKLENLFLTNDGGLRILDFGVARREDDRLRRTGRGVALGTPRTMAPEQHSSEDPDGRTDLYAAGLVLYEVLTGRGPFDEIAPENATAFAYAHRHRVPARPSVAAPQPIPRALEEVILCALEKKPFLRFGSAREMATALEKTMIAGFDKDEEPTEVDPWAPAC